MNILVYPYSTPIVLTDRIFNDYGGLLDGSTEDQRNAAYVLAEETVTEAINTLPLRTMVTGTHLYRVIEPHRVVLDYAYVHYIHTTRFIDFQENIYYTVNGTDNVYVSLRDAERGIADIGYAVSNCQCHSGARPSPYHVQFVYEAGLPSGTAYSPKVLLALTTYSKIILNEIIGYGNEAPGDVGVVEFSNQQYREKRKELKNTAFGNSAQANFANKLLEPLRQHRNIKLGGSFRDRWYEP